MSSFELNKIVGAVLLAVLTLVVIGKVGDNLVSTGPGHGGGYGVEPAGEAMTASAPAAPREEPLEPILGMLADADADAGAGVFNKCKACHTAEQGGKNGIGPNLWGVVGGQIASHEGYNYSDVLQGMSGQQWSYSNLNAFLHKPRDFAPGTKMAFAGLRRTSERAEVVKYLRTLSETPAALPTQAEIDAAMQAYEEAKAPPAEAAPAETPAEDQAAATDDSAAAQTAAAPPEVAIGERVAAASPENGARVFNKCKACHTVEQGGRNGVGPNLWGVVGSQTASHEGYNYSDALRGMSDKTWTLERLNAYLEKPRDFAKGTKMTFAGLRRDSERADLLAYLRTLQ